MRGTPLGAGAAEGLGAGAGEVLGAGDTLGAGAGEAFGACVGVRAGAGAFGAGAAFFATDLVGCEVFGTFAPFEDFTVRAPYATSPINGNEASANPKSHDRMGPPKDQTLDRGPLFDPASLPQLRGAMRWMLLPGLAACSAPNMMQTPIGFEPIRSAWFIRGGVPTGEWTVVALSNGDIPCSFFGSTTLPDQTAAALCREGAAHATLLYWRSWSDQRVGDYAPSDDLDVFLPPPGSGHLWTASAYAIEESEWPEDVEGARFPDVTADTSAQDPTGNARLLEEPDESTVVGDFDLNDSWSGRFTASSCPDVGFEDFVLVLDAVSPCP